ncbi:MAG TPA: ATP-binding protein [Anaerolineae bacterium]
MIQDFVRRLPLFANVDEDDLKWLVERAEVVPKSKGDILMREGEPSGELYIVLEGEFEFTKRSGQQEITLAVRGVGEVIGEMSFLDHAPRSATARATQDSRLLMIRQDAFQKLLSKSPPATMAILQTVTSRLRNTEIMMKQNEKMAALGTLSAGLAHELNNPAAAARRSATQLRDTLSRWQALADEFNALNPTVDQVKAMRDWHAEMVTRAASPVTLDPLTRSDREEEMQTWLEDRGVDQAWEVAPTLVGFGWDTPALAKVEEKFPGPQVRVMVRWLATGYSVYALLDEVAMSAERISEIVKAVKSYSYLDQAPVQDVDIHEGLENTLVILRHKLKQGVEVKREYATDLPHIEAYGSELNQVWTNIIDNAIDAMNGQGTLTLRTGPNDDQVMVEIGDTGPGIPPEIQSRIFEPFFTTKPPGIGTGLGLHLVYNIIQKHHGKIQIKSQPGSTWFQITLPKKLK